MLPSSCLLPVTSVHPSDDAARLPGCRGFRCFHLAQAGNPLAGQVEEGRISSAVRMDLARSDRPLPFCAINLSGESWLPCWTRTSHTDQRRSSLRRLSLAQQVHSLPPRAQDMLGRLSLGRWDGDLEIRCCERKAGTEPQCAPWATPPPHNHQNLRVSASAVFVRVGSSICNLRNRIQQTSVQVCRLCRFATAGVQPETRRDPPLLGRWFRDAFINHVKPVPDSKHACPVWHLPALPMGVRPLSRR